MAKKGVSQHAVFEAKRPRAKACAMIPARLNAIQCQFDSDDMMKRQGWRSPVLAAIIFGLVAGCRSAPHVATPSATTAVEQASGLPSSQPARLPPVPVDRPAFALVSYQEPDDLPVPGEAELVPLVPESLDASNPLELNEVISSVQRSYPLLVAVMLERDIAAGEQVSARGEFDLNVKAYGIAAPQGFYKTYRNGIALDQPLFRGGYLFGRYKIGDGNFQPWFGERETDEGGEFSAGFGIPLLKDRSIDDRRAAVFQADLTRQAVEPAVRAEMLEFVRLATQAYWSWVAAGQSLEAQRELLRNAQARVRQIQEKVDAGDLPRIARINNEQLIAARETEVIESDRKLQQAAIKLSLFVRDTLGEPIIPNSSRLPLSFPEPESPTSDQVDDKIQSAITASPVLAELELTAEQVRVDLQNAENMMLPKVDARLRASKDVGAPASPKRDKVPFELEAGLFGDVPLQRRKARGKIDAAQGKLAQIDAKRQFVVNKITAAVQDAVSALQASLDRIERAETNLRLARETLKLGRLQFDAGDIDLVTLNIYEKAVTDAQLVQIAAFADFFSALADYRAALAQDPQGAE